MEKDQEYLEKMERAEAKKLNKKPMFFVEESDSESDHSEEEELKRKQEEEEMAK